jgi:hypothetical protein
MPTTLPSTAALAAFWWRLDAIEDETEALLTLAGGKSIADIVSDSTVELKSWNKRWGC